MTNNQVIPNYLKARSPQGLRRLMIKRAARTGLFTPYTSIVYVPNEKSWYAWFNESAKESLEKEMVKDAQR